VIFLISRNISGQKNHDILLHPGVLFSKESYLRYTGWTKKAIVIISYK